MLLGKGLTLSNQKICQCKSFLRTNKQTDQQTDGPKTICPQSIDGGGIKPKHFLHLLSAMTCNTKLLKTMPEMEKLVMENDCSLDPLKLILQVPIKVLRV